MPPDDLRQLRQQQQRELAALLARHKCQKAAVAAATRDYTLPDQQEGVEWDKQAPVAQEGKLDNERV